MGYHNGDCLEQKNYLISKGLPKKKMKERKSYSLNHAFIALKINCKSV